MSDYTAESIPSGIASADYIESLAQCHEAGWPVYFEGHVPDDPAMDAILIKSGGWPVRVKIVPSEVSLPEIERNQISYSIKLMEIPVACALLDALRGRRLSGHDAVVVRTFAEQLEDKCHPAFRIGYH